MNDTTVVEVKRKGFPSKKLFRDTLNGSCTHMCIGQHMCYVRFYFITLFV